MFFMITDVVFFIRWLSFILNAHTFHHFLDRLIFFKRLIVTVLIKFSLFLNDFFGDELLVIIFTESSFKNLPMNDFAVLELTNFEITENVGAQIGVEIVSFIKRLKDLVHFLDSVPFSRKSLMFLKTHFDDILNRKSIFDGVPSIIVEELQYLCVCNIL